MHDTHNWNIWYLAYIGNLEASWTRLESLVPRDITLSAASIAKRSKRNQKSLQTLLPLHLHPLPLLLRRRRRRWISHLEKEPLSKRENVNERRIALGKVQSMSSMRCAKYERENTQKKMRLDFFFFFFWWRAEQVHFFLFLPSFSFSSPPPCSSVGCTQFDCAAELSARASCASGGAATAYARGHTSASPHRARDSDHKALSSACTRKNEKHTWNEGEEEEKQRNEEKNE